MDSGTFEPPRPHLSMTVGHPPRFVPFHLLTVLGRRQWGTSGDFPDPPTPELDAPADPNISLSNDLTFLLVSLNSMFLEHPKVGHHLRTLFRNVGYRSYWDSQRGSMAHVAEDIQRVARDAQSGVVSGAQEMARNVWQRA